VAPPRVSNAPSGAGARGYSSFTESSDQDGNSAVVSLNGTQLVMNNQARSRAPLPGFSSFVWTGVTCLTRVTVTAYHHNLVWTPVKFVKTRVAPRTKSGPGRLLRNQTAAVICDTNRDFNILLTTVIHCGKQKSNATTKNIALKKP